MRSGKTRFLKKIPKNQRGRLSIIGGHSEALSAARRAMGPSGSSRLRPSLWGAMARPPSSSGTPAPWAKAAGAELQNSQFLLWSWGTNRPADRPSAQGRPRHRARGVRVVAAKPTGAVARPPYCRGAPAPWTKAGRERAPKFSNFSKYLRLSRNPEKCVPDFEGPAPRPAPESVG